MYCRILGQHKVDDAPEVTQPRMLKRVLAGQQDPVDGAGRAVQARLHQSRRRFSPAIYRTHSTPEGHVIVDRVLSPGAEDDIDPRLMWLVPVVVTVGEVHGERIAVLTYVVPRTLDRRVAAGAGVFPRLPFARVNRKRHQMTLAMHDQEIGPGPLANERLGPAQGWAVDTGPADGPAARNLPGTGDLRWRAAPDQRYAGIRTHCRERPPDRRTTDQWPRWSGAGGCQR